MKDEKCLLFHSSDTTMVQNEEENRFILRRFVNRHELYDIVPIY